MLIEVKRWFQSREVWLNVVSAVVAIATFALANIGMLDLTPAKAFYVMVTLTAIVNIGNIVMRITSKAVIGAQADVEAAKRSSDFTGETE